MLCIEDAERLMGFSPGYTLPCYPLLKANERTPVFDEDLQTFKRFALLGLACSVPQSQWLGEQLFNPYGVKFAYDALSEPFQSACPGGAEAHSRAKAWPQAAYNMLPDPTQPNWTGRRRAPIEVTDTPLIRGFTPLGEFLHMTGPPVRYELRASYLRRLEIAHDNIDETIRSALDVKESKKRVDPDSPSAKKSRLLTVIDDASDDDDLQEDIDFLSCGVDEDGEDEDGEDHAGTAEKGEDEIDSDLDQHGMTTHGECVWVKWRVNKTQGSMYWPAIALHPLKDHAVIPNEALKISNGKLNEEHRLVIFFGGRKIAWTLAAELFGFANFYRDAMKQAIFKNKGKFITAVEEARSWSTARNLSKPMNPIVMRNTERLFKDPEPCGLCSVCAVEAVRRVLDDKPMTRRNRVLAASKDTGSNSKCQPASKCSQLKIIKLAREGHVGAVLSLRKQSAIGQRILVLWHTDSTFYTGTITAFDELNFTFRVDYDDADVDAEFKPWEEIVMLSQDIPPSVEHSPEQLKKSHAAAVLKAQMSRHALRCDEATPLETTTMRRDAAGRPVKLHK